MISLKQKKAYQENTTQRNLEKVKQYQTKQTSEKKIIVIDKQITMLR